MDSITFSSAPRYELVRTLPAVMGSVAWKLASGVPASDALQLYL